MTAQLGFDLSAEVAARDRILAAFNAGDRRPLLDYLRGRLAAQDEVTADDARPLLAALGIPPGNYLGALFKAPGWRFLRWVPSAAAGRHANRIGVWTYEPEVG